MPSSAFAYSPGDTCVLTKIVELRIDPKSSGQKRYLKPGTEVIIIEKFRKRTRVQVDDTLGTLGNRPIGKACSWKEVPAPPSPEVTPTPTEPDVPENEPSIELPPPPPEPPAEVEVAPVPVLPDRALNAPLEQSPSVPTQPQPKVKTPEPVPAAEPIEEASAPTKTELAPALAAEPLPQTIASPWIDITLGATFVSAGSALWMHVAARQQQLTDDAVAYNEADTKLNNTWYDINQRQSEIDHHQIIAMTSLCIGAAFGSLGLWSLLAEDDNTQASSSIGATDELPSSLSWTVLFSPSHWSLSLEF